MVLVKVRHYYVMVYSKFMASGKNLITLKYSGFC